jgi:hypothetical protein
MGHTTAALTVSLLATALASVAAAQGQPVPRPFPGTRTPPPPAVTQPAPTPPPAGATPSTAQVPGSPDAALAGIPLFPQAEFLDSYDAGQGQRYYLYGTNAPFEEVVGHFRTALRSGGRQLYRTPAIQQFDLGRFESDQMAFPPSVVVKDYAGGTGGGYLFVRDAAEQRFRTIIQIVPPPPGR